tara:strand:+ start:187 stop:606 length:420 start_codon:yes stop_codon:yes gene_type:complete
VNYPEWGRIASRTDLQKYYEGMRAEIAGYRNAASAASITARKYRKEAEEAKTEKKVVDKKLLHITERKKLTDETKKAGYWSGAAAITVTIFYEICKVKGIGYPGGHRFASVWTHEAVIACCTWISTVIFGLLYRIAHGK